MFQQRLNKSEETQIEEAEASRNVTIYTCRSEYLKLKARPSRKERKWTVMCTFQRRLNKSEETRIGEAEANNDIII